jgi:outer membrane protein assembly factor BamB
MIRCYDDHGLQWQTELPAEVLAVQADKGQIKAATTSGYYLIDREQGTKLQVVGQGQAWFLPKVTDGGQILVSMTGLALGLNRKGEVYYQKKLAPNLFAPLRLGPSLILTQARAIASLAPKLGTYNWRYPLKDSASSQTVPLGAGLAAADASGRLYHLDRDGVLLWEKQMPNQVTFMAPVGFSLVVGGSGYMALVSADGHNLWRTQIAPSAQDLLVASDWVMVWAIDEITLHSMQDGAVLFKQAGDWFWPPRLISGGLQLFEQTSTGIQIHRLDINALFNQRDQRVR